MVKSVKLQKFKGDGAGRVSDTIITEGAYMNLVNEQRDFEKWMTSQKRSAQEIEARKPILSDFKVVEWGYQDEVGNFITESTKATEEPAKVGRKPKEVINETN